MPMPIYPPGVSLLSMATFVSKKFETRYLAGIGEANVSRTLGQIREVSGFRDLTTIVWDNSDTISLDARKKSFFFGRRTTLQLMWEYCYLSKIDLEQSGRL